MSAHKENNGISGLEKENNTVGMLIGGGVLVVIIIVFCVLIWGLYHNDESPVPGKSPSVNGSGTGEPESLPDEAKDQESQASTEESQEETASTGSPEGQDSPGDASQNQESGENGGGQAGSENGGEQAGAENGGEAGMTFSDVDETVTAKETTNLRSIPGTTGSETVVAQLHNGEEARRTGINEETGWSRLEFNGQVLYAVNRLLTTDLSKPETNEGSNDTVTTANGRKVTFTVCDDIVSPKIECNLRTEPSTDGGEATVRYLIKSGEEVHRTGYDADRGWSRVEYNEEVLYVVSSLVYIVEEPQEEE